MGRFFHRRPAAPKPFGRRGLMPPLAPRPFGASATWVANDLDKFSAARQTQILDLLYDTSKPGAGLSWVRVGSFLCNFNPSPGVYDWGHWGIQSEMRWLQRVSAS